MLYYPHFDPVAFRIGPLKVHWYGLMYLVGIGSAWILANYRCRQQHKPWNKDQIADLIFYCAIGVIVGGRVGYMLFYNLADWIRQPLLIFKVWQGGMSFHGGLLGVMIALWFYSRRLKCGFFELTDFVVPMVPIGLGAGRLGNFINGELWGRITTVPWGMVYPNAGPLPRHPSELYEFFFEGVVLFIIMWFFSLKKRPAMAVTGLFLVCYGIFRFGLEFFRQPDPQLGFVAFGWMTRGQELSIPMFIIGVVLLILAYRRKRIIDG